jgi:hypothetical protein
VVMTQIGKVGGTWVLTLTRIDRKTLEVLARAQVQADGDSAAVLLDPVSVAVDKVLGVWVSPLLAVGGVTTGIGVVLVAGGAAAVIPAVLAHAEADAAVKAGDSQAGVDTKAFWEPIYWIGWIVMGTGGVVAVSGGAVLGVGLAESE